MFERNHGLYYARRAAQAGELGAHAANPKVAAIHFELALRYSILALRRPRPQPDSTTVAEQDRRSQPKPVQHASRLGRKLKAADTA